MSWTANQHIKMISEWSCDTEDWSKDAKRFSFTEINDIVKNYKIFFAILPFLPYFLSNKCNLGEQEM